MPRRRNPSADPAGTINTSVTPIFFPTTHNQPPEELRIEERLSFSIPDALVVTGWSRSEFYRQLAGEHVETYCIGRRRFVTSSSLRARIEELVAETKDKPVKPEPRFHGREGGRPESDPKPEPASNPEPEPVTSRRQIRYRPGYDRPKAGRRDGRSGPNLAQNQ